nr:hypothetical protein [Intestinimonas timonensis]
MELESDGGRDQYVVRDGLDGVILRTFTPDDTGLEQFKASYPELARAAYEMQSEDEFSGMVHSDGGTPPPAPGMYQVFLSMRNPMVVHAQGQAWNKLNPFMVDDERTQRALLDRYNTLKMIQGYVPPMETRQFAEMAQELGYDGVIFRDVSDGRVEDIVQPALERPGLEQKLFDILERYNNFGAPDQEMALAQIEVTGVPGQVTMEEAAVIQEYLELPEARTTLEAIPDDVYVVFDSEQIKSVHNEGTFDSANPDIRYSVSSTQPFAGQVRTALEEDVTENRNNALYIRSTPSLLREIGLPDTAMAMTARHVKDINHAPGDNPSWHGIPEEQIARIPELLEQPAMVLESGTRPGDVVVVTTELDSEGRPIVLTVHPNGSALVDGQPTPTNFITSMYGRNNFEKFLNAVIRGGGVLYWDKNRSQDLLTSARVQFPAGMRDLASNSIIRKIGGSVNENRSRPLSSVARVQSPAALTASASDTTIPQPGTDVNGESGSGTARFSIDGKPLADPLYSQMENVILDFKGEKIGAQSLISYLKGHGVKDEEIKWSGITGFLEGKKSIPKQELVDFLRANELVIEDTVLGNGVSEGQKAEIQRLRERTAAERDTFFDQAREIRGDEAVDGKSPYALFKPLLQAQVQGMTDSIKSVSGPDWDAVVEVVNRYDKFGYASSQEVIKEIERNTDTFLRDNEMSDSDAAVIREYVIWCPAWTSRLRCATTCFTKGSPASASRRTTSTRIPGMRPAALRTVSCG